MNMRGPLGWLTRALDISICKAKRRPCPHVEGIGTFVERALM
jgi:hypothetical protein